ncbi:ERF family protein [Kribbella sp. NPDC050470]|uniref:ERF family protein n=1 Tax=unclassified Kribbella TaxID=2644121 RepID=UPI0037A4B3B7
MTEQPTIYAAFSAAMEEVQAVRKEGFNDSQRYNFRGIDQVVNAVGPIFRKHKIIPMPHKCVAEYRDVLTSTGKPTREVTTTCTYRFYGPAGDYIEALVPGESLDSGDKGTAKAMSVAYRIVLLQSLCIPTDDKDPDQDSYERAVAVPPDPLVEARVAVADAWQANHPGELDPEAVQVDFTDWTNGEHFLEAPAARLLEYADHLKQEQSA